MATTTTTIPLSHPHFTLTTFLYLLLLLTTTTTTTSLSQNNDNTSSNSITISTLSFYPELSIFTSLLSSTSVSLDISTRSSLTILAVPNRHLATRRPTSADTLRLHVILQYLSLSDLLSLPPSGKLFPTLFQTTGRALDYNLGSLNITYSSSQNAVVFHSSASNSTLISSIKQIPYNLSIFTVDSFLIPTTSDLTASETRPLLGLNITKTLIESHVFNVAAAMLSASGVAAEFERDEGGAGITLFVPTDTAFSDLLPTANFQSLPASKKAEVLKFHVLRSYYPLGSLESIVNPVQPTLATEENGAGSFTLNISRVNGSVGINTGVDQATVTQTVFDQNPVAIFGVSKVLLPREIFGGHPTVDMGSSNDGADAPDFSPSPESSFYGPAGHFTSPPGSHEEIRSAGAEIKQCRGVNVVLLRWCIVLVFLV